jgi:hypothetical protein
MRPFSLDDGQIPSANNEPTCEHSRHPNDFVAVLIEHGLIFDGQGGPNDNVQSGKKMGTTRGKPGAVGALTPLPCALQSSDRYGSDVAAAGRDADALLPSLKRCLARLTDLN